jgi:formylglycine-generating enzyme required for sulfatase activity
VTRGEWRAWYLARAQVGDPEARAHVAAWDPATDAWPASMLSRAEAREYASSQGMRLPSGSEWLRIACGTAATPYPWGPNDAASVANTLELGLRAPTAVGTFEQGRAALEIYDLLGNVWEWVAEPPGRVDPPGKELWAWALGGSFLTLRAPLFDPRADEQGTLHLELDAEGRSNEVGLRLVAEASGWLEAHAAELARAPAAEGRLVAVGKRWGPAALPLLEDLVAAHPDEPALSWLLAGARR